MALIANALTTITNAKLIAGVTVATYDSWFELSINRTSLRILSELGRKLRRDEFSETLTGNGRQLLILSEWPIVSISSLVVDDYTYTVDVDYRLDAQDKASGMVYRGSGWTTYVYTMGLAEDVVAAARGIEITYEAGYYFPGDEDYVEGAEDSLPLDIQGVVDELVAASFLKMKTQSQGLKSYSEGNISMSWTDNGASGSAYSENQMAILAGYKRGEAIA